MIFRDIVRECFNLSKSHNIESNTFSFTFRPIIGPMFSLIKWVQLFIFINPLKQQISSAVCLSSDAGDFRLKKIRIQPTVHRKTESGYNTQGNSFISQVYLLNNLSLLLCVAFRWSREEEFRKGCKINSTFSIVLYHINLDDRYFYFKNERENLG